MFKKLIIQNFQRHKKLEIKFDKKITTIQGPNDAGKSAILRSLRWLVFNRPVGRAFIRHGAKFSKVTLRVGSSTVSRRIGGNSGNLYILDKKKYRAFRNDVPKDIESLFSLAEVNFQRQHEPIFWFSLSPGQVAKELNKLVDLETIDKLQAAVAKRLRDKKSELAVCERRLQEAKKIVSALSWVHPAYRILQSAQSAHFNMVAKSHILARIRVAIAARTEQRVTLQIASTAGTAAGTAGRACERWRTIHDQYTRLGGMVAEMRGITQKSTTDIPDIKPLELLNAKTDTLIKQHLRLKTLLAYAQQERDKLCQAQQKIKKKQRLLEDRLGGRCPTCGTILTNQMSL